MHLFKGSFCPDACRSDLKGHWIFLPDLLEPLLWYGRDWNLPSDLSRLRTLYFFVCRRDRDCTLPSDRPVCFPWKARSFQGILSDRPVSFYCIIFALHGLHPDFCTGHCRVPLE